MVWLRTASCAAPSLPPPASRGSRLKATRSRLTGVGRGCSNVSFSLIWSAARAVIRVPCASSPLSPPDLSSVVSCCISISRLIPRPLPRPAWSKAVSPGLLPNSLVMTGWSDLPQGRGPSARSDMVAPLAMADEPRPPRGATGASSESTGGGSRRGARLTSRGEARENGLRICYPSGMDKHLL